MNRHDALRASRRAALRELLGDTCRCGAPADCFVRASHPDAPSRRRLDPGPSDRGLTSRWDLILHAARGRRPSCRPCQLREASARRWPGARPEREGAREVPSRARTAASRRSA